MDVSMSYCILKLGGNYYFVKKNKTYRQFPRAGLKKLINNENLFKSLPS